MGTISRPRPSVRVQRAGMVLPETGMLQRGLETALIGRMADRRVLWSSSNRQLCSAKSSRIGVDKPSLACRVTISSGLLRFGYLYTHHCRLPLGRLLDPGL